MSKRAQADKIIRSHVLWSIGAGLVPIPLFDLVAITAIQMDMLGQLAKLYGADYTDSMGKNFLGALTGSTLAQVGASVIKAIPGIGTVLGGVSLSVAAGATTYAVGRVATDQLADKGNLVDVDIEKARESYQRAYEEGKDVAAEMEREKSPSRDTLEALEKLGKLREKGIITEAEFEAQKQKLLDRL